MFATAVDPEPKSLQSLCGVGTLPRMAKQDFLPNREDDLIAWQEQREWVAFKNLEFYGPLGEPIPQVPSSPPPFALSARAPGIIPRTRDMAARIKAHPAYTQQMGADLGIIGAEASPPAQIKPTGSAKALPNFKARVWEANPFADRSLACRKSGKGFPSHRDRF